MVQVTLKEATYHLIWGGGLGSDESIPTSKEQEPPITTMSRRRGPSSSPDVNRKELHRPSHRSPTLREKHPRLHPAIGRENACSLGRKKNALNRESGGRFSCKRQKRFPGERRKKLGCFQRQEPWATTTRTGDAERDDEVGGDGGTDEEQRSMARERRR